MARATGLGGCNKAYKHPGLSLFPVLEIQVYPGRPSGLHGERGAFLARNLLSLPSLSPSVRPSVRWFGSPSVHSRSLKSSTDICRPLTEVGDQCWQVVLSDQSGWRLKIWNEFGLPSEK